MSFLAIGVNHQTAPVAIRERVAFTPSSLATALKSYAKYKQSPELVILSTCNRTEVFASSDQISSDELCEWLSDVHNIKKSELERHLYSYQDQQALSHLMQVACGLDSLILGEPQILGQVKQAFSQAKNIGTVNKKFEKIFQTTFQVAKKVRTNTEIGSNAVSVAYAAVQLAKQIFAKLNKSKVLLIGAGETIELVAKHLIDSSPQQITVANRTLANAQKLANDLPDNLDLGAEAITISEIPSRLPQADIVISSTASALPILGQGMVETALKARKYKPMLLIDLAVPRDIEDEVSQLDDAYLYTVDDLQEIVQQNVANREQAAAEANVIINEQIEALASWEQHYQKLDLIKNYRDDSLAMKEQLETRALAKIAQGESAEKVIQELSHKLAQSMMHAPTKAMQKAIQEPEANALDVLEQVFSYQNK